MLYNGGEVCMLIYGIVYHILLKSQGSLRSAYVLCVASGHFFCDSGHWYLEFYVNITQFFYTFHEKFIIIKNVYYICYIFPAVVNHNLLETLYYI